MKLTFRGIQYSTNQSNVVVEESQAKGTYRGASVQFYTAKDVQDFSVSQHLVYRGIEA